MLGDSFQTRVTGRGFVKIGTEKPGLEDVRPAERGWTEAVAAMHRVHTISVILGTREIKHRHRKGVKAQRGIEY
jgi:ATP:corrinoid adenosyltransferase